MIDPQPFPEFEHTGWESLPEPYHPAFVGLTSQMIDPLLRAVGAKRGVKGIDIASGPGHVAAAAAKRGAIVLGVDFSAAMVAHAQRTAKSGGHVKAAGHANAGGAATARGKG